jgi:dihydrofolate reductase
MRKIIAALQVSIDGFIEGPNGELDWAMAEDDEVRIVRDVEEIRRLKQQPGKDMQVVGGATLVSSLMNLDLIDELQLMVNPLILGGGKALFKDVKDRHALQLVRVKPLQSGKVVLTYSTTLKDLTPTPEAVT